MKKFFQLVILLSLVSSAWAQLDTESIPPAEDQNDLFARAAASRLVVIGTVIKGEGIGKRIPPEELAEHLKNGTTLGGGFLTVRVEETICRQSDFDSKAPSVDDRPQPLYLFIPFSEQNLPQGHYREQIIQSRRYMLLLTELDAATLSAKYRLDPNRFYYRGTGHNRGVIPLSDDAAEGKPQKEPDVVGKFRKLCDAMRPPNPVDKLGLLQKLVESGDSVLQKEAEIAKAAVQASIQRTEKSRNEPKRR